MTQPTPEQRKIYQLAIYGRLNDEIYQSLPDDNRYKQAVVLADALRDTRAELMESDFKREHSEHQHGYRWNEPGIGLFCIKCGHESKWESCHGFKTSEQWREAADKLLRGE